MCVMGFSAVPHLALPLAVVLFDVHGGHSPHLPEAALDYSQVCGQLPLEATPEQQDRQASKL